ncbi:hypothetical protein SNEBB_001053 [Seison nebaliae]|nr:hypothetical protein SNEBB_001053 [Seison nebaliae]
MDENSKENCSDFTNYPFNFDLTDNLEGCTPNNKEIRVTEIRNEEIKKEEIPPKRKLSRPPTATSTISTYTAYLSNDHLKRRIRSATSNRSGRSQSQKILRENLLMKKRLERIQPTKTLTKKFLHDQYSKSRTLPPFKYNSVVRY